MGHSMPKLVRSMSTPLSAGSHPSCQGTCMSHPAPPPRDLGIRSSAWQPSGFGLAQAVAQTTKKRRRCRHRRRHGQINDIHAGIVVHITPQCPHISRCSYAPFAAARLGIADRTCYATLILDFSRTPAPFPQGTSSGSFGPLSKCHVLANKCRQNIIGRPRHFIGPIWTVSTWR